MVDWIRPGWAERTRGSGDTRFGRVIARCADGSYAIRLHTGDVVTDPAHALRRPGVAGVPGMSCATPVSPLDRRPIRRPLKVSFRAEIGRTGSGRHRKAVLQVLELHEDLTFYDSDSDLWGGPELACFVRLRREYDSRRRAARRARWLLLRFRLVHRLHRQGLRRR